MAEPTIYKHVFVVWTPHESYHSLCEDVASVAEAHGGCGHRLSIEEQTLEQVEDDKDATDSAKALFDL